MFAWWRLIIIEDDGSGWFAEPDVVPIRPSGPTRLRLRSGAGRIKRTRRTL
jgi:hypothetical protein